MRKVGGNYSRCTCRSSENTCSSSGSAQEIGKTGQNRMKLSLAQKVVYFWVWQGKRKDGSKPDETEFGTKSGVFLSLTNPRPQPTVWSLMYFLTGFFGTDRHVPTRFWTKLRVLVPCFPDFTEYSIIFSSPLSSKYWYEVGICLRSYPSG